MPLPPLRIRVLDIEHSDVVGTALMRFLATSDFLALQVLLPSLTGICMSFVLCPAGWKLPDMVKDEGVRACYETDALPNEFEERGGGVGMHCLNKRPSLASTLPLLS